MENKTTKLGLLGLSVLLAAALLPACGPSANNANQANTGNTSANKANTANTVADANKAPDSCDDAGINKAILAKVQANTEFEKIRRQINWNSRGCRVDLYGWSNVKNDTNVQTLDRRNAFKDLVLSVSTKVDIDSDGLVLYRNDYDYGFPPACAPGYVPCGDICVPEGTCNNGWDKTLATPSPTP